MTCAPLAVVVGVAAVVGGALLLDARTGVLERRLVYYPSSTVQSTPANVDLAYEDISLITSDGVRVEGWFIPGPHPATWLWLPSNAGSIGPRPLDPRTPRRGRGVGAHPELPGYGQSEGRPSEAGLYRDAEAALTHLRSREDVDPDRIVYFGRSVGTAIAVDLAARHSPYALLLEAPFPSLPRLARELYPWLPVGRFLHQGYQTETKAPHVTAPALVIHGDSDEIVPIEGGRAVAAALAGEVELFIVPGARHNDVPLVGRENYYRVIAAFLDRVGQAD